MMLHSGALHLNPYVVMRPDCYGFVFMLESGIRVAGINVTRLFPG